MFLRRLRERKCHNLRRFHPKKSRELLENLLKQLFFSDLLDIIYISSYPAHPRRITVNYWDTHDYCHVITCFKLFLYHLTQCYLLLYKKKRIQNSFPR